MIVNQCSQWQSNCHASNFKYVDSRVGKYRDIFENIENIDLYIYIYICGEFAHTLLKLYKIYYQIILLVCLCIAY